jgi:glycosyltransferase involved in cell wall biosynthesis
MNSIKEVLILGPDSVGGVCEVNRSLSYGFGLKNIRRRLVCTHIQVFLTIIKNWNTRNDFLVISSLAFGFYNIFFKKSIFILHGYPYRRNLTLTKYLLNIIGHMVLCKISSRVVAVSNLTKYVWENHLGVKVDAVIHNPYTCGLKESQQRVTAKFNNNCDGVRNVVYLGRIVGSKNLVQIFKAIRSVRDSSDLIIKFHIVGGGHDLKAISSAFTHCDNIFYDVVSQSKKFDILKLCDCFISLNEGEPFGLTALEAGVMKLNCVLPRIGGHNEFLVHSKLFLVNDVYDIDEISSKISKALSSNLNAESLMNIVAHEPEYVALRYMSLFN